MSRHKKIYDQTSNTLFFWVANLHALLVTLLPSSVGVSLHLLGSPEPNSGCRSCFRQSRILTIRLPFVKEGEGLIVIQSVFKFFPKITEKLSGFQKMKNSLLEENLKYLKN